MEPFAIDVVVPTYIPAGDLTQRVARDAGLGAYWEDGSRRLYYLRARGRLLEETERLEDLGIVPYELLHLLPHPPDGSHVAEKKPKYPETQGYSASGWLNRAVSLMVLLLWATGWAIALTASQNLLVGVLPSMGLALLATSFARHAWGGEGTHVRIPITGLLLYGILALLAAIPALVVGVNITDLLITMAPALILGLFGVTTGWLAWYGAVEPLPKQTFEEAVQEAAAVATYPCGVCGGPVTPDVRADCKFNCGQVFHSGCYTARQALANVDGCAVCGYTPG